MLLTSLSVRHQPLAVNTSLEVSNTEEGKGALFLDARQVTDESGRPNHLLILGPLFEVNHSLIHRGQ